MRALHGLAAALALSLLGSAASAQTDPGAIAPMEPAPSDLSVESELITFTFLAAPVEREDPTLLSLALKEALTRLDSSLAFAIESKTDIEPEYWRRHALEIDDDEAFNGDRLLSVVRNIYVDGGGAHPNFEFAALLWDREEEKALSFRDLFLYRLPPPTVTAAWRKELVRMKNDRFGSEDGEQMLTDYLGADPAPSWDTPVALAPSTVPGKAGGVVFLHSPYEVGAYVEGPYEVVVPYEAFASGLRLKYRDAFGGEPVAASGQ